MNELSIIFHVIISGSDRFCPTGASKQNKISKFLLVAFELIIFLGHAVEKSDHILLAVP